MVVDWGFYAHRKINYYAVYTIPPPVNIFFKTYVKFLTESAIRPDQRRYAMEWEGYRHYIDLDRWFRSGRIILTHDWVNDRILTGQWSLRSSSKDILFTEVIELEDHYYFKRDSFMLTVDKEGLRMDFRSHPMYTQEMTIAAFLYPEIKGELRYRDHLIKEGILPYHLGYAYANLVKAWKSNNIPTILSQCGDIGHYIADAHVPLHTTSNYNGQQTDQVGIHSFWETRIPELLAEKEFDQWVGPAEYIEDKQAFFWDIVLHSHSLVDSVLRLEKEVRAQISTDEQYCYEERNYQWVRLPCQSFTRAYHQAMNEMVERQWKAAIWAVGCIWYSAWIDAGSPKIYDYQIIDVDSLQIQDTVKDRFFKKGKIFGRKHEGMP